MGSTWEKFENMAVMRAQQIAGTYRKALTDEFPLNVQGRLKEHKRWGEMKCPNAGGDDGYGDGACCDQIKAN